MDFTYTHSWIKHQLSKNVNASATSPKLTTNYAIIREFMIESREKNQQ